VKLIPRKVVIVIPGWLALLILLDFCFVALNNSARIWDLVLRVFK
jgi:hypothetical protein